MLIIVGQVKRSPLMRCKDVAPGLADFFAVDDIIQNKVVANRVDDVGNAER
jgi:hypothetical protein